MALTARGASIWDGVSRNNDCPFAPLEESVARKGDSRGERVDQLLTHRRSRDLSSLPWTGLPGSHRNDLTAGAPSDDQARSPMDSRIS